MARAVVVTRLNDLAGIGGPNGFDTVRAKIHAQYAKLDKDDAKLKKAADAYLGIFELAHQLLGGRNTALIQDKEKLKILKKVESQLNKANRMVSNLSDPGLQNLEWDARKILGTMGTVSTNESLIDEGVTEGLPNRGQVLAEKETRRELLASFTEVLDGMIANGEVDEGIRASLIKRYTKIISSEGLQNDRTYVGKVEAKLKLEISGWLKVDVPVQGSEWDAGWGQGERVRFL